jgi:hypothetical protein
LLSVASNKAWVLETSEKKILMPSVSDMGHQSASILTTMYAILSLNLQCKGLTSIHFVLILFSVVYT